MADTKTYNLAQFIFNDMKITNNGFKTTRKQSIDQRKCTDDYEPYDVNVTDDQHSWELSDVDPAHRKFFGEVMDNQLTQAYEPPMVATYDYDKFSGDLVEDDVYYKVYVEEIGKENANQPFTVKGIALKRKKSI